MATTHEIATKVITENNAVGEPVQKLLRYVLQRGALPNVAYCTADQTVVGTTLTNSTYLNIVNSVGYNGGNAVVGGRKYQVTGELFLTVTASNGIKFDLNQGTATAGNFAGNYTGAAAAAVVSTSTAALATAFSSTSTILKVDIQATLEASGAGSLGLRFAESANSTGVILLRGSWLAVTELPLAIAP